MNGLLVAAIIESISSRRDGTIKIVIGCQEMSPSKSGELFSYTNKLSSIYVSPKESITQSELDQTDKLDPELQGRTQSQRIRNTLYKLFEQDTETFANFDAYYKVKTEQIINHLKSKIK